jgi:hypothetical protein
LRQLFALQNDQGALPSVGPKASRCSFLDFSFNLIGALKEYYLYSGDIELMNELMLHVQKFASCLTAYMDSDGLIDSSLANGTVFLDWSKDIDKAGKSVILNAFYSKFLEDYELLLTITGQVNTNLKSTRAKVKETINKLMFDRTRQVYRDTILGGKLSSHASMHAAYAAVYSDFVTQNQHEFLENAARTLGNSTPYGPAYFMIIFDAMNKAGDRSQIMDRIVSYWGGMLDRGATSWWEVFDSKGPAWMYPHPFLGNTPTYEKDWIPTSSCHGWGCVPGYAIPRYLLGIELLTLFKNLVIVNPPAHAHFSHFTFKVPLRGDVLWLEFDRMGSAYAVHVVQKPSGIQVEISSQVKEYNGLCTVSSSML